VTVRHVIWRGMPGQSNCVGAETGETGSDLSAVPYWKDDLVTTTPALGPLLGAASGGVGADYTIGRLLLAAGLHPIIVNVARGSTYCNQWVPGGTYYAQAVTSLTDAWSAIKAAYPGDTFVHHHMSDQGEEDARYGYPSPSPAQQAITDAWSANYETCHGVLETIVGAAMSRFVVATNYQLVNQNDPAHFRALQLAAAVLATGDTRRLITRDTADGVAYDVNGLHPTTPGYVTYGKRAAKALIDVIQTGSLTTTTRNAILNHLHNRQTISPAATHYLHLYADDALTVPLTAGTAAGYVGPASNTNNTTTWPAPSGRAVSNGAAFDFPAPSGTWPAVRGWKLTDSDTEGAGTVIASCTHPPVIASPANGTLSYPIGSITITFAGINTTGAITTEPAALADAEANGILGVIFGGTPYAPLTTAYGSHWAGDPQGSGAQAGSRVALTQASVWGAASGGVATCVAPVTLAQQITGTHWAEHSASTSGTLLRSGARPAAVGASGTIAAGQIKKQLL